MPMTTHTNTRTRRRQSGYTMLEVLIASVILTGGLIGVASLQLSGTRLNNSAYLRSQASIMAYDIIDRMRANAVAARAGTYDIDFTDPAPSAPATVPEIDLALWRQQLDYYLPQGVGGIERGAVVAATGVRRFLVTVRWNDGRGTAGEVIEFEVVTDI